MTSSISRRKLIRKILVRQNKFSMGFVIISCAMIGSWLLLSSQAATPSLLLEAENGSNSQECMEENDSTAAGAKSVVFASCSTQPFKIQTWAPQFQGFGTAGTSDNFHPEKFSIVIGNNGTIKNLVPNLKASGVKVLVYQNGGFKNRQDAGPDGNPSTADEYPNDAYALTSAGERIIENDFVNNSLMNPLSGSWKDSWHKKCLYLFTQAPYDGCFFDTIGIAPLSPSYVSPDVPVHPTTQTPWSQTEWMTAMVSNVRYTKERINNKLIYGNGLGDGSRYFTISHKLLDGLDAGMSETFVMPKDRNPTDTESEWKQNVDMLVDAKTRQKPILVQTKAWDDAPNSVKDARHKYSLATFLLGCNDFTYYNFQYSHTTTSPSTWHHWWDVDFGQPKSPYQKHASGVYVRRFQKSLVVVNPTPGTVTYDLGGRYRPIDSTATMQSITLQPRTAEIFLQYNPTDYALGHLYGYLWTDGRYATSKWIFETISPAISKRFNAVATSYAQTAGGSVLPTPYEKDDPNSNDPLVKIPVYRYELTGFPTINQTTVPDVINTGTFEQKRAFIMSVTEGEGSGQGLMIDDPDHNHINSYKALLESVGLRPYYVQRTIDTNGDNKINDDDEWQTVTTPIAGKFLGLYVPSSDWPTLQSWPFAGFGRVPGTP